MHIHHSYHDLQESSLKENDSPHGNYPPNYYESRSRDSFGSRSIDSDCLELYTVDGGNSVDNLLTGSGVSRSSSPTMVRIVLPFECVYYK